MRDPIASDVLRDPAHAVLANPPYIVEPDPAKRELHRARYVSAHMRYGLGAPFLERLPQLCVPNGFIGQITGNAFMKREYGRPLIERVLPLTDITHVIDCAGACIPGHGTPTVILFQRNRAPATPTVRAILGKRGEPATPKDPAQGEVWASIRRGLGYTVPAPRSPRDMGAIYAEILKPQLAELTLATGSQPAAAMWLVHGMLARAFRARGYTDAHLEDLMPERPAVPWQLARSVGASIAALCPPDRVGMLGRSGWATSNTDWVGDTYQHLCAVARKRYAFVQTPRFVRDVILDFTLEPAIEEFGLTGLRVLDPACGAGHFLLDAFWRLYARWAATDSEDGRDTGEGGPALTLDEAAKRALASLRGVDLNPDVEALTYVRLALAVCDATTRSPDRLWPVWGDGPALAVGDSLLEGPASVRCDAKPPKAAPELPAVRQLGLFGEAAE